MAWGCTSAEVIQNDTEVQRCTGVTQTHEGDGCHSSTAGGRSGAKNWQRKQGPVLTPQSSCVHVKQATRSTVQPCVNHGCHPAVCTAVKAQEKPSAHHTPEFSRRSRRCRQPAGENHAFRVAAAMLTSRRGQDIQRQSSEKDTGNSPVSWTRRGQVLPTQGLCGSRSSGHQGRPTPAPCLYGTSRNVSY